MQLTHKHDKWLQILGEGDFPPKLLWSENADLKLSVNNEGEDVNKKPRSRENIAQHSNLRSGVFFFGLLLWLKREKNNA